jgi:Raf kinase inhibitor-like YbhB/YbcL family protein
VRRVALLLAVGLPLAGCGGGSAAGPKLPATPVAMTLTSAAFPAGGPIPERFTCDGAGTSPPLDWSGVPPRARELALVVEDPDADRFLHWTVLGLRPSMTALAAGRVPSGVAQPRNGFGDPGWGGPCPPKGDDPHHYVFSLYALDAPLRLHAGASPETVGRAIAEHALARGELVGTYARGGD